MSVNRWLLVALLITLLEAQSVAGTLRVPQDHATIQAAVDAAGDGDTVLVAKGIYQETVAVEVPNLKLVGKKAVIDAEFGGDCITVSADGVSISGFTLVNGGPGVRIDASGSTVTGCLITDSGAEGIKVVGGSTTITNNIITRCHGYGIRYSGTLPGHVLIDRNVCRGNANAGLQASGDDMEISRNRFEDNSDAGCEVTVDAPPPGGEDLAVILERNDFFGNENQGLALINKGNTPVIVRDNESSENGWEGLFLTASGITVEGNRCDGNLGAGLLLRVDHATVSGNTARGNRLQGFVIEAGVSGDPTGDLNIVSGNIAADNGHDGFRLDLGSDNSFSGNKATGNGDDGLDIDDVACSDTVVDGNTFSGNGHEGLDNGGTGTRITNNTCLKNRRGLGPDIAGKGDGGQGSAAGFFDNHFDTGGHNASAELDF